MTQAKLEMCTHSIKRNKRLVVWRVFMQRFSLIVHVHEPGSPPPRFEDEVTLVLVLSQRAPWRRCRVAVEVWVSLGCRLGSARLRSLGVAHEPWGRSEVRPAGSEAGPAGSPEVPLGAGHRAGRGVVAAGLALGVALQEDPRRLPVVALLRLAALPWPRGRREARPPREGFPVQARGGAVERRERATL